MSVTDGSNNDLSSYRDNVLNNFYITGCSSFDMEIKNYDGHNIEYSIDDSYFTISSNDTVHKDLVSSKVYDVCFNFNNRKLNIYFTTQSVYTIKYDFNAGTDTVYGTLPTDSNIYADDNNYNIDEDLSYARPGYIFNGWGLTKTSTTAASSFTFDKNAGYIDLSTNIMTFYAVWEKVEFNIVYDLNGGSGTTPSDSNKYCIGDAIPLPDSTGLSKTNCLFKGWSLVSTAGAGDTNSYTLKANDLTNQTLTFYAVWEE